jgi:predicted CXXCH cytochrome family protein
MMNKAFVILTMMLLAPLAGTAQDASDSCVTCHSALETPVGEPAKLFQNDVHHQAGLTCADCHGGDPKELSMDAMSPAKGFRGVPKKSQIPEFCARCHSNPGYMRKYNPSIRTDQYSEYLTSVHGKRLKQGDTKAAACVDCHSVHDILPVSDPRAPVYVTNVASTCAKCHADAEHMKGYNIPTNQFALYSKSVHAKALEGGDTSAPTCTTCHGNHGATPPGVTSVANVCGTCHAFNQQLFEKSPHQAAFAAMGLPGCVQCHSNHEILPPTDAMVGTGEKAVCITCHSKGDPGYAGAEKIATDISGLVALQDRAKAVLNVAERSGMEVSSGKVELTNARADLIKARVNVHAFDPAEVKKLTDEGSKISRQAYEAGVAALKERDYRRKGLGVALVFIVLAIGGLYLKIRQIESRPQG